MKPYFVVCWNRIYREGHDRQQRAAAIGNKGERYHDDHKKSDRKTTELTLDGWLDTQSAPLLGSALEELGPETESLVLDLSKLEYTSSAGIRQIVAAHKKMEGALRLTHVSTEVMDVLRMAGLDKKLHIES